MNLTIPSNTLIPIILKSFDVFSKQIFIIYDEKLIGYKISYRDFQERVLCLSLKMLELNIKTGDRVAILSNNHPFWIIAETSSLLIGAVTVPINPGLGPEIIKKILSHSEAKLLFIQDGSFLKKQSAISNSLSKVNHVIQFNSHPIYKHGSMPLSSIILEMNKINHVHDILKNSAKWLEADEFKYIQKRISKITPSTLASLQYTNFSSDTETDDIVKFEFNKIKTVNESAYIPLAVPLTHANIYSNVYALSKTIPINYHDRFFSILPQWNPMERVATFLAVYRGSSIVFSAVKSLFRNIRLNQPTFLILIPKILSLIYKRIERIRKKLPLFYRILFYPSLFLSMHWMNAKKFFTKEETLFNKRTFGKTVLFALINGLKLIFLMPFVPLFKRIFAPIHQLFGREMKYIISGGRSLSPEMDLFFDTIGITILEGYGFPEAGPVISIRRPKSANYKPRRTLYTTGPLLENTDIKLIDPETGLDISRIPGAKGVIFVKGPQVMKGYYLNPSATKNKFDDDHWFNTHDIGRFTISYELQILGKSDYTNFKE